MIFCEENRRLLEQAIRNDAAIFPIAHHRKADGTLDVEGNLKVWLAAAKPFTKTYLWPHVTHWGELCTEWLEEYGF